MFVCTLGAGHITYDVIQIGSSVVVLVPIGFDREDDSDISYFASVGVDVTAGGGWEMFFHILEYDHHTGAEHRYWSGKDTEAFIVGHDRARVLDAVCGAAQALIDHGSPDEIEVVTYDADPPEKAIIKHLTVMSVFERNGYRIKTFDPHHGRRIWILIR